MWLHGMENKTHAEPGAKLCRAVSISPSSELSAAFKPSEMCQKGTFGDIFSAEGLEEVTFSEDGNPGPASPAIFN